VCYRQIVEYYSGEEDAFDMRKSLPRDVEKLAVKPVPKFKISPEELEFD